MLEIALLVFVFIWALAGGVALGWLIDGAEETPPFGVAAIMILAGPASLGVMIGAMYARRKAESSDV